MDILRARVVCALQNVFEEPVFGWHQFTQPRPRSLKGPGHGKALLHQIADVLLEAKFIDLVVLKAAADENAASPPEKESQDRNVEIRATKEMWHGKVVVEEDFGHDEAIDVGLMRPQQC